MSKRIFVGIKASNSLLKEIKFWRVKYEKKLKVRWIADKNLHLTLIPPWYEKDIKQVKTILNNMTIELEPFTIQYIKVSFGPSKSHPRLIWATGKSSKRSIHLKILLEKKLEKTKEKRQFKPHLTIARFREKDFSGFPIKELNEKVNWIQKVNSFILFESKLSRKGAEYQVLEKIKLE